MTTIAIDLDRAGEIILNVNGHCEHDVCVSISALVNSFFQYAKDFESKDKCVTVTNLYEYGNVDLLLRFYSISDKQNFIRGIDAILTGFELYQENFKDEVKFIKNHLPRGDI